MSIKKVFIALAVVCLTSSGLVASPAEAQRRGGGGRGGGGHVSGGGRGGGGVVVVRRPVYVRSGFRPAVYASYGWYPAYGFYPWYASPFGYYPFYGYGYGFGYGYPYGRGYIGAVSSVRLQVEPKHARVFVDGYFAGTVDDYDGFFQRLDLEPGQHEIQLYLEGYRAVTERLYLEPGKSIKVRLAMEPLGAGEAQEPPPAPVAPSPGPPPPPGRGVRGRGPDEFQAPRPMEREGERQGFGQLAVRVQPAGAEVFVDGESWQAPEGQERLVVHLAAGSHRIEVRREGYRPFTTTVQVRSGETTPLNVSLLED